MKERRYQFETEQVASTLKGTRVFFSKIIVEIYSCSSLFPPNILLKFRSEALPSAYLKFNPDTNHLKTTWLLAIIVKAVEDREYFWCSLKKEKGKEDHWEKKRKKGKHERWLWTNENIPPPVLDLLLLKYKNKRNPQIE